MATQRYMGKHKLLKRLSAQVGSEQLAKNILVKRGDMTQDGKLTAHGRSRDNMTAAERAKDRAAKRSGGAPSDYTYNPRKNTAKRKK